MTTRHPIGDESGSAPPGLPRGRALPAGLALVLAASAVWSAVTLLSRHQPAPRAGAAATASAAPVPTPAPVVIPTQGPVSALGDLQMETPTSGWARRLRDGAVLHTASGVRHWVVASPPGTVLAFAPIDALRARALTAPARGIGGPSIRSWATRDGGATWTGEGGIAVNPLSVSAASLDFVDADHGWFSEVSGGTGTVSILLFRTEDGGEHWVRLRATVADAARAAGGSRTCGLLTMSFSAPRTGWITGSCESGPPPLYVSRDGGATWKPAPLPGPPGNTSGNTSFPPVFTSAQNGFLVTESEGSDPVSAGIFTSVDGGATWIRRVSMSGTPLGDAFVGVAPEWLVLDSPYGDAAAPELYTSDDGGGTWSRLGAFPYLGLRLDFVTAAVGWAAPPDAPLDGTAPYLLETEDGGRTWTAVRPTIGPPAPT